MKRLYSFLALLCMLLVIPVAQVMADRDVVQPQFGKQVITVAEDETITFTDPKGDVDYSGKQDENAQSMTVFVPGKEGMSVKITFESMNMGGMGNYYSIANVYSGDPDAANTFKWATTTTGTTGVPTQYSDGLLPEGGILRAYPNEKGKTYTDESYYSASADGMLSVAFAYRYAYSCTGWKAKVKLIRLEDQKVTSATSLYDGVASLPSKTQNVLLAGVNVVTTGVLNPDKLTSVSYKVPVNEGVVDATKLRLVDASGNVLTTVCTEASGTYTLTTESTLSEGNNILYIYGDLASEAIGAKVQVEPVGVTTAAVPSGVASFVKADAVTVTVPAIAVMTAEPQTVVVGDIPLAFFDEGGKDGKVKQNANGTVIFTPLTEGKKIMVDFTSVNIWHGTLYNQEIRIYNGTEVSTENLLKTLQNGETAKVRSTSADGALTVVLFSDTQATSFENDGFEARVSQFAPQPMTVNTVTVAAATEAKTMAGDIAEMLKITVNTENTEPALVPASFSFSTNGTSGMATKAEVFSTKSGKDFSSAKKIGEADITGDKVNVTLTDALSLIEGDNCFWMAYNVVSTAKDGEKLSASLEKIVFANGTEAKDEANVKVEREIFNIAVAAEGTKTILVDGKFGLQSEQYASNPENYSAPGTEDRILVFKPANAGYVCQLDITEMEVYYSSSSYGTKCKFAVYSGEGTSGEKLWEVTAPTKSSYNNGPGKVLRSVSADGALTVVYNPNTTYFYYCGKGFKGDVTEYLTKDQQVDAVEVSQASSDALSVGAKKQALLDVNVKVSGTFNPKSLSEVHVDFKGTEATVSKVSLYKGDTEVATADVNGAAVALTFSEPAALIEGDNHFTVTVDVKDDAEVDALVDAKVTAISLGSDDVTVADGDPEGNRVVKYMYMLQSGDNETVTVSDRSLMFYDDGGNAANSSRNFTGTVTFKPSADGKAIKLTFKNLKLGAYSDKMQVYDGDAVKTSADKEYGYYDTSNPYGYDTTVPEPYVSKAEDGSLTVKWTTGSSSSAVSDFAIEVSVYEKVDLAVTDVATAAGETTEVLKGTENVMMQKVSLTVEGDKNVVAVSGIKVAAAESAALGKIKVYATGTGNTFATTTLIGEADEAGNIAVDYTVTKAGTYNFWVAYDVKTTANADDKASCKVTAVTANGAEIVVAEPAEASATVISGKSGTYTVGVGGDYATLQSAVNSLAIGVEGPVTISVLPGTYNERVMIPAIKGTSSVNTITIKGAGSKRGNVKIFHDQYAKPAYGETGYGVITFDGASYVTLQNLTVTTEDKTYKGVIYVRNASRHITIDGCYLSAPLATSYSEGDIHIIGHYVDNSKDADGNYKQDNNNDYLTVRNNVIEGGYMGISMGGTSYVALPKEVGGVIENNIIRGQGSKAIYVMDELGAKINNNVIYNVAETASGFLGIDMQVRDAYTQPTEVKGNTIYLANGNSAGGMQLRQLTGTETAPVVIDHNEIRVVSKYAATFGVKFSSSTYQNVQFTHNSIRVTPAASVVSAGSNALWFSSKLETAENFEVSDNIALTEGDDAGFAVNLYNDDNIGKIQFTANTLYTGGGSFARASASTVMTFDNWKERMGDTECKSTLVGFKDEYRLFPSADVDGRGALPYDEAQTAADHAAGDPQYDEEWGTPVPEPSKPVLAADEEVTAVVGEEYTLSATLAEGTAPYTVTWKNGAGKVIGEPVVYDALPADAITMTVTAEECCEYTVSVVDANEKAASAVIRMIATGTQVPATFENLSLESESAYSGIYELENEDDYMRESTFVNGSYSFYQGTMPEYSMWWGIGYANCTATSYATLDNQFRNCVGGGYAGSKNYAIVYYSAYNGPDCNPAVTVLNKEEGDKVAGMYVTNAAYAYTSMSNGDSYAKKFVKGDWLKITATGYDKDNNKTGETDFYLADMRSENEDERYILDDWKYMDLSVLGTVKRIEFTMLSSDSGAYGMNTPAYFAFDNFGAERSADAIENVKSSDFAAPRAVYTIDGRQHNTLQRGVNVVRMADGTIRKVMR